MLGEYRRLTRYCCVLRSEYIEVKLFLILGVGEGYLINLAMKWKNINIYSSLAIIHLFSAYSSRE
jgi:hypothetical protein